MSDEYRKIKGLILSGFLISSAIVVSVLSFTSKCQSGSNGFEDVNRGLGISLVCFSIASSLFEHHTRSKLEKTETENSELKSVLQSNNNSVNGMNQANDQANDQANEQNMNEPFQISITPVNGTNKSDDTVYPAPCIYKT